MLIDLTDDEIGLIQEALYTKIQELKDFQINDDDKKEIFEYEALLDKLDIYQENLESGRKEE